MSNGRTKDTVEGMRSLGKQDPKIPQIFCQTTDTNESLGSLMSAVFQREFRSKRFQRIQTGQAEIERQTIQNIDITITKRAVSEPRVLVIIRESESEQDEDFHEALTIAAWMKGFTVVGIHTYNMDSFDQLRAVITFVSNSNPGSSISLFGEQMPWMMAATNSLGSVLRMINGVVILESTAKPHPEIASELPVPTLFFSNQKKVLLQNKNQPLIFVLTLPSEVTDALGEVSVKEVVLDDETALSWICLSVVDFFDSVDMKCKYADKSAGNHLSKL